MSEIHEQLAMVAREVRRLADGVDRSRLHDRTPCADYDVEDLIAHLMQEMVLHGWDLAVGTGQVPEFSDEVSATVLRRLDVEADALRNDQWYAAAVPASGDSSLLDQAVARSGRDPVLLDRSPS